MLKPKISIITVVFNAKDALKLTIDNIKSLNYENIEYIVVDGGSSDGTKELIEVESQYITKWISKTDKGIYDAMNRGLAMAEGEYVWFINAGDLVNASDLLSNIFSGYEELADIYYGDTIILSSEGKEKGLRRKKLPKKLSLRSFKFGMVVCHQSILVKRSIAPLYNPEYRYAADIEWVMESVKRAKKIVNTRFIISKFIEGGVSTTNRRTSLDERYKIMVKYFGTFHTLFYHILIAFQLLKPKYRPIKYPY